MVAMLTLGAPINNQTLEHGAATLQALAQLKVHHAYIAATHVNTIVKTLDSLCAEGRKRSLKEVVALLIVLLKHMRSEHTDAIASRLNTASSPMLTFAILCFFAGVRYGEQYSCPDAVLSWNYDGRVYPYNLPDQWSVTRKIDFVDRVDVEARTQKWGQDLSGRFGLQMNAGQEKKALLLRHIGRISMLIRHGDRRVRLAAVRLVSSLDLIKLHPFHQASPYVHAFMNCINDPSAYVRVAAIEAIGCHGSQCPDEQQGELANLVAARLTDADSTVRAAILQTLVALTLATRHLAAHAAAIVACLGAHGPARHAVNALVSMAQHSVIPGGIISTNLEHSNAAIKG
jgi:hypothetical protein